MGAHACWAAKFLAISDRGDFIRSGHRLPDLQGRADRDRARSRFGLWPALSALDRVGRRWGGQSPVFYNLFVGGAALAVIEGGNAIDEGRFRRLSLLAMFLTELAIQIKYSVLAEAFCFGLLLTM